MTVALITLALISPFALAAVLGWTAHRSGVLRWNLDQFRVSAPMLGRLFSDDWAVDRDLDRVRHDLGAVRTRFEEHPSWPSSGALGERR
ncbi:hypothetical protein JRC04_25230 [Mycolicibacterium sp. S2-37]|uniref:hypothetical protein n=1 Tax=Mycolicibacterium sp. S2-37 TaxID=2810297 RepID=UPI001A93EDE0|nr:hypothetical protein [Mycolicibacterium sp. S2-37]MBO0680782.1 hypothetical protein [Mycolicibacterium sp. S2-37]